MQESDLYLPIKRFLEGQGYEVKGEIKKCDVVAVRGEEEPVVVELKLSLNLSVVLQCVERLSITPLVYIGIPKKATVLKTRRKPVIKMLRMLGLGLLAVDPTSTIGRVEVLADPGEYRPRESKARKDRLLGEFAKRVGDPNLGGTAMKRGIMTAYRQTAMAIARHLQAEGPMKAAEVGKALGESKAHAILYRDVYGWFTRVSKGVYGLSPRGAAEVALWLDTGSVDAEGMEVAATATAEKAEGEEAAAAAPAADADEFDGVSIADSD